jgi:hypothetical protein
METALYFPHIRVPRTPWFSQVLLYWDAAAAIIPSGLERDEAYLGSYMSELIRAGLVTVIRPDEALMRASDGFEREFLTLLGSRPAMPATESERWTPVHCDKLGWSIFQHLADRGLARPADGPGWSSWWEVEKQTAELYLTYLAGAICGSRQGFSPVADSTDPVAALARPGAEVTARLRALRYAVVSRALPVPAGPVPVAELKSFKDRHHDGLRRLRVHLDGRLTDLAAIDDEDLRRVKADSVVQEISDEVAVLREQMARRAWPGVLLVGVGGVVGSALATATGVATGGNALILGLAVGGGVASLGSASHRAFELARAPRVDRRAPLVYAALVQRAFADAHGV